MWSVFRVIAMLARPQYAGSSWVLNCSMSWKKPSMVPSASASLNNSFPAQAAFSSLHSLANTQCLPWKLQFWLEYLLCWKRPQLVGKVVPFCTKSLVWPSQPSAILAEPTEIVPWSQACWTFLTNMAWTSNFLYKSKVEECYRTPLFSTHWLWQLLIACNWGWPLSFLTSVMPECLHWEWKSLIGSYMINDSSGPKALDRVETVSAWPSRSSAASSFQSTLELLVALKKLWPKIGTAEYCSSLHRVTPSSEHFARERLASSLRRLCMPWDVANAAHWLEHSRRLSWTQEKGSTT